MKTIIQLVVGCLLSQALFAQPKITSFTPASGPVGTTVNITGTNFGASPTDNIVYFGATKSSVTAASTTLLTVTVPIGATYEPITVTTNGLTAYSTLPFVVTFKGGGGPFNESSFAPRVDYATGIAPTSNGLSDLDGDGKTDVIMGDYDSPTLIAFRNTSSSGNISFAPKKSFTTNGNPIYPSVGDFDGNGKPDIVTVHSNSNTVSILRNTSIIGNISFDTKVDFAVGTNPTYGAVGDIDGDGKPDIVVANNSSNSFSVLRNTGTTGNISFEPKIDFATGPSPFDCSIGDLDGDGKPDIAIGYNGTTYISMFRNTSTVGAISFAPKVDVETQTIDWNDIALGDLDGDGKPDIAGVSFDNNSVFLFRNTSTIGTISFGAKITYMTGGEGSSRIYINDLNGDAKPEIAVGNYWTQNISIFRNLSSIGSITFDQSVLYSMGSGPLVPTSSDLDGDGKPDIASGNIFSGTFSVFRNTIVPSNVPVISSITNINSSQAVVHWNAFENASVYRLRIYPTGTTKYKYYGYETPITETFKKILNLLPATSYEVQVMAIVNSGTDSTAWSAPYNFTTEAYCNPPTGLSVSNISNHGAQLNWASPVTAVSHYELRVRKAGETTWITKPVKPTKLNFVLTGLSPNTSYQWQLRSGCINIADKSNWAKGPDFTTASAVAFSSKEAIVTGNNAGNVGVQITPNPNKGNFSIQMQLPAIAASTTLALYNEFGQLVWQQSLGNISGSVSRTIALENKLSAGLYTLTIQRSDIKLNQKMLINK